jgi:hypothetical protein
MNTCASGSCRWKVQFRTFQASRCSVIQSLPGLLAAWKGSTMDHEWLFWDNQDFWNQIGLGKIGAAK